MSYTYDPVDGLMLTAANGTDTLTWTYDNLDRVATEASTKNASTVGYTYDDAGNRTTLSLDGATYVTYGYDAAEPADEHHARGERLRLRLRHGLTPHVHDLPERCRDHLRLRRRSRASRRSPRTRARRRSRASRYVLDAVGNRTRKTTLDWAEDYGYDELYRLVSADRSGGHAVALALRLRCASGTARRTRRTTRPTGRPTTT